MLAEARRSRSGLAWRLRKFHRNAGCTVALAFDQHLAMRHVRLRECLRHRVDGAGGDAGWHQMVAEFVGFETGQRAFELCAKCGDMLEPIGIAAETRIPEQIVASNLLAEAAKLAIIDDAKKDLAVTGRKLVVRRDVGMGTA